MCNIFVDIERNGVDMKLFLQLFLAIFSSLFLSEYVMYVISTYIMYVICTENFVGALVSSKCGHLPV